MVRDMTQGNPTRSLLAFALPLILGNFFQQLYSVVDTVVVGKFVGSSALAAVGASGAATFLFVALATGGGAGCTVVISQLFGARRMADMKSSAYTALLSMAGLGAVFSAVGLLWGGQVLRLMRTPAEVLPDALSYLRLYCVAVLFMFLYNAVTAAFNALGDSRTPLMLLLLASGVNVILDLLFVLRFSLGVTGVAVATLIAQCASSLAGLALLLYRLRRIETGPCALFSPARLATVCRVALPSMIQQSIVSLGFLFVQALVNRYGPIMMAGYTAATKIDNLALLPMMNVGNALSAFTAQNIGADRPERIPYGLRAACGLAAGIGLGLTGVLLLFGRQLMGFFVDPSVDAAVVDVGLEYLRAVSAFYFVMGILNNFYGLLRGAGDMAAFLLCTLSNFGVRIAGAYLLSALVGPSAIWWALPLGWFAGLVPSAARYLSGAWKGRSLVRAADAPQ